MKMLLGKVDYENRGNAINAVDIEWSLVDGCFSMSGGVWDGRHNDYLACGQMIEEIGKLFPSNEKLQRMVKVWKVYHLNDMNAGSPAQKAHLETVSFPGYPVSYYDWATDELAKVGLQPDPGYLYKGKPYRYGSAWLREEIPADVIAEIESW